MTLKKLHNNDTNIIKRLSIQISLNGFSFCIINCDTNFIEKIEVSSFKAKFSPEQTLQALTREFDNNPLLQSDFKKIEVIYDNDLYGFVPKALFDPSNQKEYLRYAIKTLATDFITHDSIKQYDLINVYVPYANINNYIFERFGSFEYYHATTLLVEQLLQKEKNNDKPTVFVYVNTTNFHLIAVQNGTLKICNTFVHETAEDFLYYLMFTAEQLQLNPEDFSLYVLGTIDTEHPYYKIAYKYIRNIQLLNDVNNSNHGPDLSYHKDFIFINRL